jgi:diacylglycerol kinase (ATP)
VTSPASAPPEDGEDAPPRPVLLAVNPTAGSGRGLRAGEAARAVFGGRAELLIADSAQALQERVRKRLVEEQDACALVVVGGDGMVHLGVDLVAATEVPLGIVAAGTGNDNARELGLPVGDPTAAAHIVRTALAAGHTRAVDAARWSGPDGATGWFTGVLGAGFDSIVNERANRWQRLRGRIRYDLAILRELPVFRPRSYDLSLDGHTRHTRAVLVAVGNGPAYGGGMRICHGAVMDDGLIDVVVAGPLGRIGLLRLYPKVWSGAHLHHPMVSLQRAATVTIDSPGIVAYADGERLAPLPLTCEVVPGAVRLLAP